jgi:hypothetical protein
MTRPPDTVVRQDGNDEIIVKRLHEQIRTLEAERVVLKEQLLKRETDLQELVQLRERLVEKDEKIQQLVTQVAEHRARQVTRAPVKLPSFVQSREITEAIQVVLPSIEVCFDEWSERAHLEQPKGKAVPRDAHVIVRLAVTSDGLGHDAVAKAHDSPSVRLCVEHALTRVSYPKGPENLQLEVALLWSGGLVNMTGRVVGRSEARGSSELDL